MRIHFFVISNINLAPLVKRAKLKKVKRTWLVLRDEFSVFLFQAVWNNGFTTGHKSTQLMGR